MEPIRAKTRAAIVHNLYMTTADAFPHPYIAECGSHRIAMIFNGNIPSTPSEQAARAFLEQHGMRLDTRADTEMLAKHIVWHLNDTRGNAQKAFARTQDAFPDGSFNVTFMTDDSHIHSYRDKEGRHPLVWGQTHDLPKLDLRRGGLHVLASESSAITRIWDNADEADVHDVLPGMHVHFGPGIMQPALSQLFEPNRKLCDFEFSYFGNRLTKFDGTPILKVRYMSGESLAEQDHEWILSLLSEGRIPIVVGVPESSKVAAEGYADRAHLRRVDALLRNPNIDRTFIANDEIRTQMLEEKFEINWEMLHDQDVVLIDDSLVRGNTMRVLIQQMRNPPADVRERIRQKTGKEFTVRIHVRFAYPPVMGPCHHGISFPTVSELQVPKVAGDWTPDQGPIPREAEAAVAQSIGADTVRFLLPKALHRAIGRSPSEMCSSCFTRKYHSRPVQALLKT